MKKIDMREFTTTRFLGITQDNFKPIYLPMLLSIILFMLGVVVQLLTSNTQLFKLIFGLTGIIFALSGIGQIKLKEVPGFPFLRGGCAIFFGVIFLLFFTALGIGVIFLE